MEEDRLTTVRTQIKFIENELERISHSEERVNKALVGVKKDTARVKEPPSAVLFARVEELFSYAVGDEKGEAIHRSDFERKVKQRDLMRAKIAEKEKEWKVKIISIDATGGVIFQDEAFETEGTPHSYVVKPDADGNLMVVPAQEPDEGGG